MPKAAFSMIARQNAKPALNDKASTAAKALLLTQLSFCHGRHCLSKIFFAAFFKHRAGALVLLL
jgi:hypothetical protein